MLKETKIFIFCSIVTLFIFNFFQNQLSGNYYNQALIFCLPMLWPGIAHGSLDILIAKNLGIIRNKQHLAGFISLYILLACCMIFLWYQFPFFSLIFFLIISVMHFGISDNLKSEEQNYFLKMLIRGFTPICMPFFFHQKEVENIFLILTKNSVLIERFHFINIWITFFIFIIFLILIIKMLFNKENNFVKDKFFHATAIEKLIKESDPAKGAGRWLSNVNNSTRLSRFLCDALSGILRVIDDKPVKAFIAKTAHKGLKQIDLRQLMVTSLNSVTKERQHQVVLDKVLGKLASLMSQPSTQEYIAETLVAWLKTEYSRVEKILPSSWLSEKGALIAVKAVSSILDDIYHDAEHPIRHAFDEQVHEFLYELQHSPLMEEKVNRYKAQLVYDPALNGYIHKSWQRFHAWLLASLEAREGLVETKVSRWLQELGISLTENSDLSQAFNTHIGEAAKYMAPELADFLTRHIRDTINSWDEREMAEQVELNIGRDLQKVRINGTLVGGLIGAILFAVERLIGS